MQRKELEKGYELIADVGRELVVIDEEGNELARAKSVTIPAEGTLNNWIEVVESIKEQPKEEDLKAAKIAELERQLAELKAQ